MNVSHLILRELAYRKLSFALSVVAGCVAVACLVAALTILRQHDRRTDQIFAAKEVQTRALMAKLEEDYRKITLGLGFNVLILPQGQNLSDLYANDFASHYIPEAYAQRLATSRVATIQHLLPSLQAKLKWPEADRTMILMGVRGEVPILHADPKKPLLEAVPPGTIVLGYELHRPLKLKTGDRLKLLGREFKIAKLHSERGTKDDITAWINLREAQELLDKKGLVNGILALECVCAADSLVKVRDEIRAILPDTQVIEFQSQTLARAEARQRAGAEARDAIAREKLNRSRLRQEREALAATLVPTVVLASGLWIALLAWGNVRERRPELGLWRALGLRSRQILAIFLGRACLAGLCSALVGYPAGLLAGLIWQEGPRNVTGLPWSSGLFLAVLLAAPLLAALASWLPALLAAQQDPAEVLREP